MQSVEGAARPSDNRSVADEIAYLVHRAKTHERLGADATDDVSRAIHLRFQRLYQDKAEELRRVDIDHSQAQEY